MSEREFLSVFSKRLRYYLELNNMTQRELAEELGVGPTSVHNWLSGQKAPRMDKVDRMCEIFHCRRSDLIQDQEKPGYYLDPETAKMTQELFEDKNMRVLFDAARGSKPEDILWVADTLNRLKRTNPDG